MDNVHQVLVVLESRTNKFDATMATVTNRLRSLERLAMVEIGFRGADLAMDVVGGVTNHLQHAVTLASALNETANKVAETFGPGTKEVLRFADEMSKLGANKNLVLDSAASLGLLAQGFGYSADAAQGLATKFTKLAADAESFYNIPFQEIAQSIRSGLSGEMPDRLKAMGVILTEDAVKAEAVAHGWMKIGGQLTPTAKIMARAELIARGLSKATGDLERTQDSWANTMRRMGAQVDNLYAKIGQELIPILTPFAVALSDQISLIDQAFDAGGVNDFFDAFAIGSANATAAVKNLEGTFVVLKARFHDFVRDAIVGYLTLDSVVKPLTGLSTKDTLVESLKQLKDATKGSKASAAISDFLHLLTDKEAETTPVTDALDKIEADREAALEEIAKRRVEAKDTPVGKSGAVPGLADLPEKVKKESHSMEDVLSYAHKLQTAAIQDPNTEILKKIEANTRPPVVNPGPGFQGGSFAPVLP